MTWSRIHNRIRKMAFRVNNQVKRGLHRLEDCLKQVERNKGLLESNANQVKLTTWISCLIYMGKLNFDHVDEISR